MLTLKDEQGLPIQFSSPVQTAIDDGSYFAAIDILLHDGSRLPGELLRLAEIECEKWCTPGWRVIIEPYLGRIRVMFIQVRAAD